MPHGSTPWLAQIDTARALTTSVNSQTLPYHLQARVLGIDLLHYGSFWPGSPRRRGFAAFNALDSQDKTTGSRGKSPCSTYLMHRSAMGRVQAPLASSLPSLFLRGSARTNAPLCLSSTAGSVTMCRCRWRRSGFNQNFRCRLGSNSP